MKIAYLGQKGIPAISGGIERHVEELATRMAENGHEIFVYTRSHYTPTKLKTYKNVSLINLPSIFTKHLDAITHTLFATFHSLFSHYDIIHYHGVGPALLSFIPRIFKPSAKVIVTFHCLDRKHEKWNWLARTALKLGELAACFFPHQTIVVSKNLQEYCLKNYKRETVYLPNGIEVGEKFSGSDKIKKLFKLEPKKYFLMVSRLIPHKNLEEAIKVFNRLPNLDYKLVITGGGFFTDDYVEFLKKLASPNKNIIFTGIQQGETLKQLYQNALAFILPSKNEGLSLSLLEALSFKLPTIVRSIPENREFIKKDLVLTFTNLKNLEEEILAIIKKPEVFAKIGIKACKFVKEYYSWSKIIQATDLLYYKTVYGNNYLEFKNKRTSEVN
ncbi:glycosyltransferase family 4 protein [Patescibacteria group bacterium]|nr:glycosyltransferase family 4 protein [Patescibacteria group bacterium]